MAKNQRPELEVDVSSVVNSEAQAPAKGAESVVNQTIVQTINPGLAKQKADNERIRKLNSDFMKKLKSDPIITYAPPKHYAGILSPIYAFTLNGYDVVVRFDGTKQKFPQTVYQYLMVKLARILDSSTSQENIIEL